MLVNREHILKRERFEVESVAGVVISRDGLRVAVDHYRLEAVLMERERGVTAAVIELNSLPDAVRSAAQDDDFLLLRWRGFVFFLVGRIQVRGIAFEFCGAGVHALVHRADVMFLAQVADFFLCTLPIFQAPYGCQPFVGKAHALRIAQHLSRKRFHGMLLQFKLHVVNFLELVEEPRIN